MFNYGGTTGNFSAKRVTRGITPGDSDSYRTLYCGMSFPFLTDPSVYRSRPGWPWTSTDPQNSQPLRWTVRIRRDKNFQGSRTPTTKSTHSSFQAQWLRLAGACIKSWIVDKRKVQTPTKRDWILSVLQIDWLLVQASFNRWEHCREVKWVRMARVVQWLERPTQHVQVPPHEMGKSDVNRRGRDWRGRGEQLSLRI